MVKIPKTDYDNKLHKVYHQARKLPQQTTFLWMEHLSRYVSKIPAITFLDLGCGTGRFSEIIADRFNCRVIGVEPSDKMREKAEQSIRDSNVSFIKGDAEHIPIPDKSCTHAWLSMVLHHISNLNDCAKELRRVLSKDGLIFIRNAFKENLKHICMYQYFPRALEVDTRRLPEMSQIVNVFEKNGIRFITHDVIDQVIDNSFAEHINRLRQRGISTLEILSDDEFEQGIKNMEKACLTMDPTQPIVEKIDLLVFQNTV